MDEDTKCTFRTKDLNQAAFFWCQDGTRLIRLDGEKLKGKTIFFIFELSMKEEDLGSLIIRYANGETTVEPQKFVSKQASLRDLLHGNLSKLSQGADR